MLILDEHQYEFGALSKYVCKRLYCILLSPGLPQIGQASHAGQAGPLGDRTEKFRQVLEGIATPLEGNALSV